MKTINTKSESMGCAIMLLIFVMLAVTFCGAPDLYDSWVLDAKIAECKKLVNSE